MKKLLLLLLALIPFIKVDAITYYNDLVEVSEDTPNAIKKEVKLYNTYELKRVNKGYKNKDKCEYYDEFDFEETEKGISLTKINEDDLMYQTVYVNYFLSVEGFKLYNINEDMNIREIYLLYKGKVQPIYIEEEGLENLNDKNLSTSKLVKKGSDITIKFAQYFDIHNVELRIISDKELDITIGFDIIDVNRYFHYLYEMKGNVLNFVNNTNHNKLEEVVGIRDNGITLNNYYKNIDRKYMCYEYEKVPLNEYVEKGDNLILDDYKTIYKYYLQDYIEINDEFLTNKLDKTKLIKSTSYDISKIKIEDNINYNKTGKYNIKITIGDHTYIHPVTYLKESKNNKPETIVETVYEKEFIPEYITEYVEKECITNNVEDVKNSEEKITLLSSINPFLILIIILLSSKLVLKKRKN